jgi:hypothetical protein
MHFRKSSISSGEYYEGQHRFEHWYRDNTIYFITARCRDRYPAFQSEHAKAIFWDRFAHYSARYDFKPLITSLLDNHYHSMLYGKRGENLGPLMRHLHGSVAKLVNDLLAHRLAPFWYDTGKQGYFDGCIRDELQHRRAHRYVLLQSVRHGIVSDHRLYPHTREVVTVDAAVKRAHEIGAYLEDVPYKRYQRWREKWNARGYS